MAIVLLSRYLGDMLLKQKVLSFARLEVFDILGASGADGHKNRLVLDSTTLRHLSILQSQDGTSRGTLFGYLNQTKTPMGLRHLKRWLAAPLLVPHHINERLDVVEWFLGHDTILSEFRSEISNVPDVERLLTKVCTRGLQEKRNAVYFDDVHSKYFAEFVNLLDSLSSIHSSLKKLGESGSRRPNRLLALTCSAAESCVGQLPDLESAVEEVKGCLVQNAMKHWTLKEVRIQ